MDSAATKLIVYGTDGCHLCDEAAPVVQQVASRLGRSVEYRDVALCAGDTTDIEARIPVVENAAGRQIAWPFDAGDLYRFLL